MDDIALDLEHNLHMEMAGYFEAPEIWSHMHRVMDLYNLIYVTKGTFYLLDDNVEKVIKSGDIYLMRRNIEHRGMQPSCEAVEYYWVYFYAETTEIPAEFPNDLNNGHAYVAIQFQPKHPEKIRMIFNQLIDSFIRPHYSVNLCNTCLKLLLYELTNQRLEVDHISNTNRRFSYMLEWIQLNASQDIGLDFLADKFMYNKAHLARMFKQKTGNTVIGFITETRMRSARHYLIATDILIKQIAAIIGYSDEKYFMRTFKKYNHVTPSEYRNAYSQTILNNH